MPLWENSIVSNIKKLNIEYNLYSCQSGKSIQVVNSQLWKKKIEKRVGTPKAGVYVYISKS